MVKIWSQSDWRIKGFRLVRKLYSVKLSRKTFSVNQNLPYEAILLDTILVKIWSQSSRMIKTYMLVSKNRGSEEFCKIHRKIPVLESLFNKVASRRVYCKFTRERLHRSYFPVNFVKSLRKSFLQKTAGRMLLNWLLVAHMFKL